VLRTLQLLVVAELLVCSSSLRQVSVSVFFVFQLLVLFSFSMFTVVSTSAIVYLERLLSRITFYMSSEA